MTLLQFHRMISDFAVAHPELLDKEVMGTEVPITTIEYDRDHDMVDVV